VAEKPPPWEDLDADDNGLAAVYFWIQGRLDLPENKELKDRLVYFPSRVRPKKSKVDLGTAYQRLALKEAKIGNRHRLAKLVWNFEKAARPAPADYPDYRYQPAQLNDEVRQFIAKFLVMVKPSAGTGRRGKPPNLEHQLNRQRIKRHVEIFQILLKRDYSGRSDTEIRNRAIDLVHASFSRFIDIAGKKIDLDSLEKSNISRDTIANLFIKKTKT
jgi:hypothetical protein